MKHVLLVMIIAVFSSPVQAEGLLLWGSGDDFDRKARVLDRIASRKEAHRVSIEPQRVIVPGVNGVIDYDGAYSGPYLQLARDAARRHGVPENLFLRLVQQESGWNAGAVSHKGAIGLAQLMPRTARVLGVNPRDPVDNLDGGARYLKQQYDRFRTWRLALAAYNAGPEAVERYGGIPPYRETRNYVTAILGS